MINAVKYIVVAGATLIAFGALQSALWGLLIAVALLYVAVVAEQAVKQHAKRTRERREQARRIARRADRQHRQILRGNLAGMYGAWPVPDLGEDTPFWLRQND